MTMPPTSPILRSLPPINLRMPRRNRTLRDPRHPILRTRIPLPAAHEQTSPPVLRTQKVIERQKGCDRISENAVRT